jgi:hypothetical protein
MLLQAIGVGISVGRESEGPGMPDCMTTHARVDAGASSQTQTIYT